MKTLLSLFLFLMISINSTYAIDEVQGFWKSVDDETGRIQSIVAIYEYEGKYFGRIIATYGHNGEIADSIESAISPLWPYVAMMRPKYFPSYS